MGTVWVVKNDGTRQCDDRNQGTPLADTQRELESLGAEVLSSEKRYDCWLYPAVCGAPTGRLNAHKISEADWKKIESGFVGPNGFRLWTCEEGENSRLLSLDGAPNESGGEIPWPLIHAMQASSSVSFHPVMIRELIGRESRYYEYGSPITKDFRPDRVNIVTEVDSNVIKDIWFG